MRDPKKPKKDFDDEVPSNQNKILNVKIVLFRKEMLMIRRILIKSNGNKHVISANYLVSYSVVIFVQRYFIFLVLVYNQFLKAISNVNNVRVKDIQDPLLVKLSILYNNDNLFILNYLL